MCHKQISFQDSGKGVQKFVIKGSMDLKVLELQTPLEIF